MCGNKQRPLGGDKAEAMCLEVQQDSHPQPSWHGNRNPITGREAGTLSKEEEASGMLTGSCWHDPALGVFEEFIQRLLGAGARNR